MNVLPMFSMPTDVHGRFPQALAPGETRSISVSGTSAGAALSATAATVAAIQAGRKTIVRVAADLAVYLKFGADSVPTATSSDMLFPAGVETFVVPDGMGYVAAIAADGSSTGACTVTIME